MPNGTTLASQRFLSWLVDCPLKGKIAAIEQKVCPGHERGFGRRQEQRAGGDLVRASWPAQQIGWAARAVGGLAALETAEDARGVDPARRQRSGTDTIRGMIDRQALSELN